MKLLMGVLIVSALAVAFADDEESWPPVPIPLPQQPLDYYIDHGTMEISNYRFTLWDMATFSDPSKLSQLWARCTTPATSEMRGRAYNGIINWVSMGATGRAAMEVLVGGGIWAILKDSMRSEALMFQKNFYPRDDATTGASGVNWWGGLHDWKIPMKIYVSGPIDGKGVDTLKIDYDLSINKPLIERPLIDEVRVVPHSNGNLLLGRMYMRLIPGLPTMFLWFTLERNPYRSVSQN